MKKITAILLLFCLVFATAGYHFVFRYQISEAKSEMKKQLQASSDHKEDITAFNLTREELATVEWENAHEFRFNGEMYDLISKQSKNGVLHLRCIADEKETALLDQYMDINRNNLPGKKTLNSLIQLICAQFIPPAAVTMNAAVYLPVNFPSYSSNLFSVTYPIHTPPPRDC
ncbi:MAG: hypothetical protein ACJ749_11370 [Flavisolibacter sp.]